MHVFIVYAHPSEESFTRHMRDNFIEELRAEGHTYEISDLYEMNFTSDLSESEYLREAFYDSETPVPGDVLNEQEKINRCDALVFIYPVFWTEAPSKLVGWFDRVWTYGFAYGEKTMKQLDKSLVLCTTGRSVAHLKEHGHYQSMRAVMLGDRIFDRAKEKEMYFFDGMTRSDPESREGNWGSHLDQVRQLARTL